MRSPRSKFLYLFASFTLYLLPGLAAEAVAQTGLPYDVVYVRQPRYGNNINTLWPDTSRPARAEPGADLMLLHPDGTEEVLVAGGNGAVTDPTISFDARWVYYAYFYDMTPEALNQGQAFLPYQGSDIFRINLETREIQQLTFGEFTPNTGAGNWSHTPLKIDNEHNALGYGILNLGPSPLPGGKVIFTSNRNAFVPPKEGTVPTLQMYVMDEDGSNVRAVAPMTIGSALHPYVLMDGRVMFSSFENQGIRDREPWGLWAMYPDGRHFEPLMSAYVPGRVLHFATQMGNGDIIVENYYGTNNNGFGVFYRFPVDTPFETPPFHSAFLDENPDIWHTERNNQPSVFQIPFSPWGIEAITPFTHEGDNPAPIGTSGIRVGKVQHPSAAPGGDLLLAYTPYAANHRPPPILPYYDSGLYLQVGGEQIWDPAELVLIKNDPAYNEAWPRPVVTYEAIYGIPEPVEIPWLPNDGTLHQELPAGTPHALVGASSLYKRESFPGWVHPDQDTFDGLDAFNTDLEPQSYNWLFQGADAGKYADSEIWALRVLALEPNSHRVHGPNKGKHFVNHAGERIHILGEIPVRKRDGGGGEILDPEGNPDTSFLFKMPADTPFTFQTIDRNGMVLNMAQTWHQVRPGEVRTDCGGCHSHSQAPLDFELTEAASPSYQMFDLGAETPMLTEGFGADPELTVLPQSLVDVEFYRDIRPILERSCISCHTKNNPDPPGNLVLDDTSLHDGLPGDYVRLAADEDANWGYQPIIESRLWKQGNASRYIRKFQSRRSLLMWKLFGQRLDGWTNSDHPTESVPGNPNTLPQGTDPGTADIDFTGEIMPPPGTEPPLTHDEKMLFARWIDLGAPINSGEETGDGDFGWFLDEIRPTLTVNLPRAGLNTGEVDVVRIGMADANSGLDLATFSVQMDIAVEGRNAMDELADLFAEVNPGIYEMHLSNPLPPGVDRHLYAEVADLQGNFTRLEVEFTVEDPSNVYHLLTVAKTGAGNGTVTSDPSGINCGLDCDESFLEGTVVALDPGADEGSTFTGWTGDPDCFDGVVTMTEDLTCTADFFRQPLLSITLTGSGSGLVNSSQGGIDCPPDCEEGYDPGTVLTLNTLPDPGSMFVAWSGDPDCADGNLTMDDDRSCVGQFEIERLLTITLGGSGTGTVTTSPSGIDCPPNCDEVFPHGTVVDLIATPDPGSAFVAFTGGPQCAAGQVTMDQAHTCAAFFDDMPVLTMGFDGEGSGSVTSAPAGIDCPPDCTETYDEGTVVDLIPEPDVGSVFALWKGSQSDCLDGQVTMTNNRDCQAKFDLIEYTVTLEPIGPGNGSIKSSPGGMNCGTNCTHDFDYGTVVTLIPDPGGQSQFVGWAGDDDCLDGMLTVTEPIFCQGIFDVLPPNSWNLTYSIIGTGNGTVTSAPGGINCDPDCFENYAEGTVVQMTAHPAAGSTFKAWKGAHADCTDGNLTMNGNRDCQAEFELQFHTVTVTKNGTGQGTVTSSPAGINCGATCDGDFGHGTVVTLTPTAAGGSQFIGWSGHPDCTDGVLTVTQPMTCTATFDLEAPGEHLLTVALAGNGSGSVTSAPAGIDCAPDCTETYTEGTVVALTATPATGSTFTQWQGPSDCLDGVVTMNAGLECTAVFDLREHTVAVSKAGTGSGTVTSNPLGINCGSTCSFDWLYGTSVVLQATPDAGSWLSHWSGHPDCLDGLLTVTEDLSCTAHFEVTVPGDYTLTISKSGTGTGNVTSAPGGISCDPDCVEDYEEGTVVTLFANPDTGSVFDRWTGQSDCIDGVVTMDDDISCTAKFLIEKHTLSVSKSGSGAGLIRTQPKGINCGATCSNEFNYGTSVLLDAVPEPGSVFLGWSGDTDCNDGTVTMNNPRNCVGTFGVADYTLNVTLKGTGSGSVTSSPGGIDCAPDCAEDYSDGTVVTLFANPDAGSHFTAWGGAADCSDGVVTMTKSFNCTAFFGTDPVLTVQLKGNGSGSVTSSPGGINCGGDCQESYPPGTTVTLTADPNPGSVFNGWSGNADCSDGVVTLDNSTLCKANFVRVQ